MKVKTYKDSKKFWAEVSPELKKEEARNCLLLGLAYNFVKNPGGCFYQAALFDGKTFAGAVMGSAYSTRRNLLITALTRPEYAEDLYKAVREAELKLTGLIGETETAKLYRDLFKADGYDLRVVMEQGVYRCRKTKLPALPKGFKFRAAEVKDAKKLGVWVESFRAEAVPHDPRIEGVEFAKEKIKQRMLYVIEQNGTIVSMAATSRDMESSSAVVMVYTPKGLRKKGYASLVTGYLTQHLLDHGKKETNLFTDMSNPTSNKIYKEVGYEFVCNSIYYGLSSKA